MEIKILRSDKEEFEVEVDNLTLVELLRSYLIKDSEVSFAAWKRNHPTENPILLVKTKGKDAKKLVNSAISEIIKDLDGILVDFKALK
jgi:DNA-directed RNA polymerase subunit L